jgi:sterol desaturase/sphingolipid hydroxylase (fatty acid hydroxylase superfamily)
MLPGRLESYIFLGALFSFALVETFRPLRPPQLSTPRRWLNHTVLLALNTVLSVLLFRGGLVVFASLMAAGGHGLLNHFASFYALRFAVGFFAVDLVHYASHYTYHQIPFLWRFHQVHHADPEFDVTTGFRFHPAEALLTQSCNFALIALLGPPALAVLAAEAATLFQDIFEHANIEVPPRLDRFLRWFLTTPNMHRIHHSVQRSGQDRNFGTILPWWDRLFGTYAQPSIELKRMETGLEGYPAPQSASIGRTLAMPFTASSPGS